MPITTRGAYSGIRTPGAGLLPKSVQAAAIKYQEAVQQLREAEARHAELAHPNAVEAARQRDVTEFKTTKKVGHKFATQHAQNIVDATQEVEGLKQLANDAEGVLIAAARAAERPKPSDLSAEREAVSKLTQLFAQSRVQTDVLRWLSDPSRPFAFAGISPVEKLLQAVRDELEGTRAGEGNFFGLAGKDAQVTANPGNTDWTPRPRGTEVALPGGEKFIISGPAVHAGDAVEGIR